MPPIHRVQSNLERTMLLQTCCMLKCPTVHIFSNQDYTPVAVTVTWMAPAGTRMRVTVDTVDIADTRQRYERPTDDSGKDRNADAPDRCDCSGRGRATPSQKHLVPPQLEGRRLQVGSSIVASAHAE